MDDKLSVRVDKTNAVIVRPDGRWATKDHGLNPICPHCKTVLLHNRDTFLVTTVGSVHRYECGKCRKQYRTIELPVPVDTTPEQFYEKIRSFLNESE